MYTKSDQCTHVAVLKEWEMFCQRKKEKKEWEMNNLMLEGVTKNKGGVTSTNKNIFCVQTFLCTKNPSKNMIETNVFFLVICWD